MGMTPTFLTGRRLGLRGQHTLYAVALSAAMVLILIGISYIGAKDLVQQSAQLQLHEAAETIATPMAQALDVAGRELKTLARERLFTSALLDVPGRNAYLLPYLARHELPTDIDYNLALADFHGDILAARKTRPGYRDQPWFRTMLDRGRPYSGIEMRKGSATLYLAVPILYGRQGHYEGALVMDSDLSAWLSPEQDALPRSLGIASMELIAADQVLARQVMSTPPQVVSVAIPIKAPGLTLDPPLELRVSMDQTLFERPLDKLFIKHISVGLLAILAAAVISGMVARTQTRRIEMLAQEARNIALNGRSSISLTDGHFGNDEVSDLANSLSNLLHKLNARSKNLEIQVEQRTAELNRAQHIAKIGIWSIDLPTHTMVWSPETYRILGALPDDQATLESFLACVAPDDRKRVDEALQTALVTGRFDIEHRIMAPGIRRHVHSVGEVTYSRKGKPLRAVGTSREVTAEREAARALIDSEAYNKALFEGSQIPLVIMDPVSGRVVDCNSAAAQIHGMAGPEALIGMAMLGLSAPVQYDGTPSTTAMARHVAAALETGAVLFEWRHQRPSGEPWDAEIRLMRFRHKERPLLQLGLQDISERKRTEARMIEALVVFKASNQGIMTIDDQGLIVSVNPAFCAITGYTAEEAIGRKASSLNAPPPHQDAGVYQITNQSLEAKGSWEGEIWSQRKNGEIYPQWLSISAVHEEKTGQVFEYVALFSDISERKKQQEEVWRQANFDALTGLANRNLLQDRLTQALAHARRNGSKVGLLFLDLDGFKWINDTLGHDVGDELLVEVSHRLQATVRQEDTVARLGGDEFTMVIQHLDRQDSLENIGEKIVTALRRPFGLASGVQHISGSVGIATYPDDAADASTLMRYADIAMYHAKQAGRNRVQCFSEHMQADALVRRMEAERRVALDARGRSV